MEGWVKKDVNGCVEYSTVCQGFNLYVVVMGNASVLCKVCTIGGDMIFCNSFRDIRQGANICEMVAYSVYNAFSLFSEHCEMQAEKAPKNSPRQSHYKSARIELEHYFFTP